MGSDVPFSEVRELLEGHGWEFIRIDLPYRIFTKPGRLSILVPVKDRKVEARDFARIRAALAKEEGIDPAGA